MAKRAMKGRPAKTPASIDFDAGLAGIAAMNVEQLRDLWRQKRGQEPPAASKELLARALAYWLQEEVLGGLDARVRKLLSATSSGAGPPARHVKVGSVIVREHQGKLHEVLVVPGGFCWQGQLFASLSTIARQITGTSWNGPRFFGLRGEGAPTADAVVPATAAADPRPAAPRAGSIMARPPAKHRGGAA